MSIDPKALYQFTGSQLMELATVLISRAKEIEGPTTRHMEMSTGRVKQHLLEKGYRVTSKGGLLQLARNLSLTRIRRGKEYWYLTDEIENIPPRTSKD